MPPREAARAERPEDATSTQEDAPSRPTLVHPGKRAEADEKPGPWRSYKEVLARLAQRLIDAQRPMRILNTLRWPQAVEEQFLKGRSRELPVIEYDPDLGFDPEAK